MPDRITASDFCGSSDIIEKIMKSRTRDISLHFCYITGVISCMLKSRAHHIPDITDSSIYFPECALHSQALRFVRSHTTSCPIAHSKHARARLTRHGLHRTRGTGTDIDAYMREQDRQCDTRRTRRPCTGLGRYAAGRTRRTRSASGSSTALPRTLERE